VDSTANRAHQHSTNLKRTTGGTVELHESSYRAPDHAISRSRGGLTTKIQALYDTNLRPSVILLGPGRGSDSPIFPEVLGSLRVPRIGGGRPRTTPVRALGDEAYLSKANSVMLRERNIEAAIPERSDEIVNWKRRRRNGGRAPGRLLALAAEIWRNWPLETPTNDPSSPTTMRTHSFRPHMRGSDSHSGCRAADRKISAQGWPYPRWLSGELALVETRRGGPQHAAPYGGRGTCYASRHSLDQAPRVQMIAATECGRPDPRVVQKSAT
jgi:hypothetical protein